MSVDNTDDIESDTVIDDVVSDVVADEVDDAIDDIEMSDAAPAETTVIVEAPAEIAAPDNDMELGMIVGALSGRLSAVEAQLSAMSVGVDIALNDAGEALDAVDDLADDTSEVISETINNAEVVEGEHGEPDTLAVDEVQPESSRVHPWFRSRSDWRDSRK